MCYKTHTYSKDAISAKCRQTDVNALVDIFPSGYFGIAFTPSVHLALATGLVLVPANSQHSYTRIQPIPHGGISPYSGSSIGCLDTRYPAWGISATAGSGWVRVAVNCVITAGGYFQPGFEEPRKVTEARYTRE
ncbi:hypothetical protein P175DRAFT_0532209 [Aspergillus ochraceoroseus IBT 24754]|uniref:Uncharacterized protein n=1 Tax=Aspergillus ochraceoroseus IBT 24754 TaxID=1392256 RepID=A0A2T5LX28_9EURO|nr:uncharacterized protein P175DRAFT_0532209 [Aspergillus ochraceoroseus IBT 24754]PTU20846.1 hypothetical protein P175DRAFT_0532209 [Aspergillus ochraceoroseus IBT 24754]